MGMTIEDCISKLIEILEEATEDENAVCYVTDIDEPTLKMAIDTMHKYQKIQEIINNTDYIEEDVIRYKMICGVMNNDQISKSTSK